MREARSRMPNRETSLISSRALTNGHRGNYFINFVQIIQPKKFLLRLESDHRKSEVHSPCIDASIAVARKTQTRNATCHVVHNACTVSPEADCRSTCMHMGLTAATLARSSAGRIVPLPTRELFSSWQWVKTAECIGLDVLRLRFVVTNKRFTTEGGRSSSVHVSSAAFLFGHSIDFTRRQTPKRSVFQLWSLTDDCLQARKSQEETVIAERGFRPSGTEK